MPRVIREFIEVRNHTDFFREYGYMPITCTESDGMTTLCSM